VESGGQIAREILQRTIAAVPLPPLVASARGYPFHGRADQLARLDQAWAAVERGPSRLVLVAGEPGVGKTRTVVEFARRLHANGAVVLAGSCAPDPIGSYQPVREALRHYVGAVGPATIAERFPEQLPYLARVVADLGPAGAADQPAVGDPELQRLALFDAVGAVIAQAGGEHPALLLIDDLHWADHSTAVLVHHLLRTLPPHRLLLLATVRPHEIGTDHPLTGLVAGLRSTDVVDRIDLGGLDLAGVRALLTARAGHELDNELLGLADELYGITEGNPFFVIQLVRHLFETGRLVVEDGRWHMIGDRLPLDIPVEVREVVERRLANLTRNCQMLLRAAAVLGLEFDLQPLTEVSGQDPNTALGLLEEAMAWRVVGEVAGVIDRFQFVHAMFRQTLYDGLSLTRRQRLHERAAAACRSARADATDVANHLLAAAAAAPPAAIVDAVLAAGREAIDRTGYETAVDLCSRALSTLGPRLADTDRLALVALRAEAKLFTGAVDDARDDVVTSATLAEATGDIATMADVLIAWCHTAPMLGPARDVLRLCDRALAALPAGDDVRRARLMGSLCHQLVYAEPLPSIERRALDAYALARRIGDTEAIGDAATGYRLVADYRPLAERRHDVLDAIAEVAPAGGARPGRLLLGQHALIHAMERGDRAAFDEALADYRGLADELAYPVGRAVALRARSTIALCEGRLREAEELAAAAVELTPYAIVSYTASVFATYRELDRLAEVAPAVPGFIADFPDIVTWRVVALGIEHELGRTDAVTAGLAGLAADDFREIEGALAMRANVAVLSELAAAVEDEAVAETLLGRFVGWSGQNLAIEEYICLGASDRYLAQLETVIGRFDAAETRLEAAIGFDEAFGSELWAAYDRLALARVLILRGGRGDAPRAAQALEEAAAVADRSGSARLRRLVDLEASR
jgi:tetratricopeptide (TPR) repeat protein